CARRTICGRVGLRAATTSGPSSARAAGSSILLWSERLPVQRAGAEAFDLLTQIGRRPATGVPALSELLLYHAESSGDRDNAEFGRQLQHGRDFLHGTINFTGHSVRDARSHANL